MKSGGFTHRGPVLKRVTANFGTKYPSARELLRIFLAGTRKLVKQVPVCATIGYRVIINRSSLALKLAANGELVTQRARHSV